MVGGELETRGRKESGERLKKALPPPTIPEMPFRAQQIIKGFFKIRPNFNPNLFHA